MYANTQNGFVALISTIIVAAVLLILAVSVASSGFQGRFSVFDAEIKEVSRGAAEGCVETALLRYVQADGDDYLDTSITTFPETGISIGVAECDIVLAERKNGSTILVRTRADFHGAVTNLEVEFDDTSPYGTTSWKELAEF